MEIKMETGGKKLTSTLYLCRKNTIENIAGIQPEELSFINKILSKDEKYIHLNRFKEQIFIQVLPDDKELFQQKELARKEATKFLKQCKRLEIDEILIRNYCSEKNLILAFAEGLALANYQFLKYFSEKKVSPLKRIYLEDDTVNDHEVQELENTVKAVYQSRNLINEPLSYLTAHQLGEEFKKLGKEAGFSVEVFDNRKIESLKMGGLLAVNKGSIDPPSFSILEWKPENAKNKQPIVLVGKGVVYDSGGLSLKPTKDSMDYMKSDMSGAAAVAGALFAVAKNNLPVHVIGLVPATDNRPDGNAYVPGDVIKMYNGSTVEVLNTDAEGRMILADALSYAKKYNPELVIDLATLTGAAAVAIGKQGIVGMGTLERETFDRIKQAGEEVYERIVEFPLWEEYDELLKSDIADQKNIGGREAGAISAGKFLQKFTSYPWLHLDIAGPAYVHGADSYRGKGGVGIGVRLLYQYLKSY